MNRQSQYLFEAPFVTERNRYTNLYTNPEDYSNSEWESKWELQENSPVSFPLSEDEWELTSGINQQEFLFETETAGFVPIAVEKPGGGRIRNKRDPSSKDIVSVQGTGGRKIPLHRLAANAWQALVAEARAAGIKAPLLLPASGYRSSKLQNQLWQKALKRYDDSAEKARQWVAPPGSSAHQSGRAIDLWLGFGISSKNVQKMRATPAYKWLVENAARFGFYPYPKEPWHWEYNPPA